jgi:hypothetical protein
MAADPIMPEILLDNVWANITMVKYEKSAKYIVLPQFYTVYIQKYQLLNNQ